MPKESFYNQADMDVFTTTAISGKELNSRGLHVNWGPEDNLITVGSVSLGWAGINRLIKTLRKARDQKFGAPE